MNISVINGPNLNLLGKREPHIYGAETLADLERSIAERFPSVDFSFFQSNHEGALIDTMQGLMDSECCGIVINPGALTHYSYSVRDCIAAISIPVIEVHISNIHIREEFRKISVIAPVCKAQLSGFGFDGYYCAVDMLLNYNEGPVHDQSCYF